MEHATQALTSDLVPLIDLSDFDAAEGRAAIAENIRAACVSTGFFLIEGHGISQAVWDGAIAASRRYFKLPEAERLADVVDERFHRGFMPAAEGLRATVESYELSLDLPLDDPDVVAGHFLHGPNRWPQNHAWFREAVEPYLHAMLDLGERLERLFALSLGLEEDYFVKLCKKPTFHMRLLHYFAQTEEEKKHHIATGAHSDFGMLTILMQDPNGGLELQLRDGEWVKAPYVEGSLVINVGDMLELWTNELYVSTPHRVIGLTGRDRYSIPAFFSPRVETLVECIPSCLEAGETPKFTPIRTGDYLRQRMALETATTMDGIQAVGGHRQPAS